MLESFAGITDFGAFVLAIIVFLAIPGPGNLALVTSTAKGRIAGGLAATLGVIAGDQILLWAAVAGVSAVLLASPAAFGLVQWAGAAYLAWLGWRMIRSRPGDAPILDIRAGQYFRQALLITLLNPKAIVFYMAFFPLFIDPLRHQGLLTFGVMALTIAVISAVYALGLCALADAVTAQVKAHRRLARWLERLAGACLIGFGLKLGIA